MQFFLIYRYENIFTFTVTRYLRFLYSYSVDAAEVECAQLLPLPIDDVQRRFRSEFHLYETAMVRVQPLAYDHLIDADPAITSLLDRLLKYFQSAPPSVLQFHQSVSGTGTEDRDESKKHARVDVDEFATLHIFPKEKKNCTK